MTKRGHTVYHYGHADSVINCTEHITVTNNDILKRSYSNLDSWKTNGFNQDVNTEAFKIFNNNCITEINKRLKSKNEFILCWFGFGHEICAREFYNKAIVVEPSIGYDSMFAPVKIFETKSQMHKMHGASNTEIEFGKEFSVYPGFDSDDFEFLTEKSNVALFLGRITEHKGAKFVYDVCNYIGQEIIFAGPNIIKLPDTKYCKFVGFVEPEQRKQLLSRAKFLFAPSFFIEPCNWTVIEAQFSGTPTITTDFGGFVETVRNKITGYRCSTQASFIDAIKNIKEIRPYTCYLNAINNFTITKQCDDYEEIFKSLIH
jgi:glycosyltransferase involved in cell wall biosynthesis